MNELAPLILFVYNRPEHTKRTIESLRNVHMASESELYVFSDGAKYKNEVDIISSVRNYLKSISGFKNITIIEREQNIGLADSVIQGVTEIFTNYNKVIVLEDDLTFSRNFLLFMNAALNEFEDVKNVFSISGFSFPINIPHDYKHNIYLGLRASSWGWGTWKDRWIKVDWRVEDFNLFIENKYLVNRFNKGGRDLTRMLKNQVEGKIDSWAVRWSYAHFKNESFCIYPVKSKVQNIGTDSSGIHSVTTNKFYVNLDSSNDAGHIDINISPDERISASFRNFFQLTLWERIYWKIRRSFKVKN